MQYGTVVLREMLMKLHRLRYLGAIAGACIIAVLSPRPAPGQLAGTRSNVTSFAPVDATALGVTRPASIGLFANVDQYTGEAGFGLGNGAMRGFLAGSSYHWSVGAGFA